MNENQTTQPGVDLGEVVMIPVGGEIADTPAPDLTTEAPVKKRGRPSKAELAAREAAESKGEGEGTAEAEKPATAPANAAADGVFDAESVPTLGVYLMNPSSQVPAPATAFSAGADVRANFDGVEEIEVYTGPNKKSAGAVRENYGERSIVLQPGSRAKIPTGLIFDIPAGWKITASPRSGLSLRQGMTLANAVAVIDCDYTDETFILVSNTSHLRVEIKHGDRIAQIALEKVNPYAVKVLTAPPGPKSERVGGMGSTGVQ